MASTDINQPIYDEEDEDFLVRKALVGRTVDKKYQVLELVGQGGMSTVYKARHTLTGRIVALKLMHSHLLTDNSAVRRFQQEATASSQLDHKNCISVHDFGVTEDGQPYLVMDFLEGKSLSEVIHTEGKLEVFRAIMIFNQACLALEDAHKHRIIHRDLKPSNIMLTSHDGETDFVKVVDFGIAKILPQEGSDALKLTATGEVFGSPLYMSPEQCLGKPMDARSDIYSFGCLMYETLTGKLPFEGANALETMYKQSHEEAPPLSGVNADIRVVHRMDAIIRKCLAKNPAQRYVSFKELDAELEQVVLAERGSKALAKMQLGSSWAAVQLVNKLGTSKKIVIALSIVAFLFAGMIPLAYYLSIAPELSRSEDKKIVGLQLSNPRLDYDTHNQKSILFEGISNLASQTKSPLEAWYKKKDKMYFALQNGEWDGVRTDWNQMLPPPPQIDSNNADFADALTMYATACGNLGDYKPAENAVARAINIYESMDKNWLSDFSVRARVIAGRANWQDGKSSNNQLKLRAAKENYDAFIHLYRNSIDNSLRVDLWSKGLGLSDMGTFYYENADNRGVMGTTATAALTRAVEYLKLADDNVWSQIQGGKHNKGAVENQIGLCYARIAALPETADGDRRRAYEQAEDYFTKAYLTLADTSENQRDLIKVLSNDCEVQFKENKMSQAFANLDKVKKMRGALSNVNDGPAR